MFSRRSSDLRDVLGLPRGAEEQHAEQLGHNPTVSLDTYDHVMRDLAGAERISAEEQIALARKALDVGGDQLRFFEPDV